MTYQRLGHVSLVVMWLGMATAAAASDVLLTVATPSPLAEGGIAEARLRLGVVPGATVGFDKQWDVPAPPSPSGSFVTLMAGIVPSPTDVNQQLLWDFREETFPQTWTIDVTSDQTAPVTLSWQSTPSGNSCAPVEWTLEDAFSGTRLSLNAGAGSSYEYLAPSPRTRRFLVTAEAPQVEEAPPTPQNLWSPRQGRASVYLAWSDVVIADVRYHVYRQTDQGPVRLTTTPLDGSSYVVTGVDRSAPVTYQVTAVGTSGCESPYSSPLTLPAHR